LVAVDSHAVAGCVLGSRHTHGFSILYIELRSVSWANQAVAIEFSVSEGAAVVRAHVFDAVHILSHVDEDYKSLVDLKGFWCVWSQFAPIAYILEFGHSFRGFQTCMQTALLSLLE
jgi:hypothetical protein